MTMSRAYRMQEHTADKAMKVEGSTLRELFTAAAEGLAHAYSPTDGIGASLRFRVETESASLERLLVEFLSELVYLHETRGMLFCGFEVEFEGEGTEGPFRVKADVMGEEYDPSRHELDSPVKAVTQHMLAVDRTPGGWTATLVLDT